MIYKPLFGILWLIYWLWRGLRARRQWLAMNCGHWQSEPMYMMAVMRILLILMNLHLCTDPYRHVHEGIQYRPLGEESAAMRLRDCRFKGNCVRTAWAPALAVQSTLQPKKIDLISSEHAGRNCDLDLQRKGSWSYSIYVRTFCIVGCAEACRFWVR